MIRIHLPPHELSLLQQTFRTTSDRRLRDRAQIVLMAHKGRKHADIADDLCITPRGVQRWLNAYVERGLDGLQPRHAKGNPRTEVRYPGITAALETLLSDELVSLLTKPAMNSGHVWQTTDASSGWSRSIQRDGHSDGCIRARRPTHGS